MGLFDDLKKIGQDILTNIQNAQNQSSSNSGSTYVENTVVPVPDKVVPAEYSNFPAFGKTPLRMTTTKAANNIRCSINSLSIISSSSDNIPFCSISANL